MDNTKKILNIAIENNGIITSAKVTELGISRTYLSQLVRSGELQKVDRGIYALPEAWEDEFYILQARYPAGIFSHESALFLLSFTDRTPSVITMTFPYGYHAQTLKGKVIIKKANREFYELGIEEILSPNGHTVRVYSIERTLCDILRGKNAIDIEQNLPAIKKYTNSSEKNIPLLIEYAEKLRVLNKLRKYLEVLL
ncbi:MAG TPA: type IV toxin-antitoxin system AbiEi family antitoxin domain-containing protein [bacterium]|nr:type IV toxin-antitoxin system AbiEi family antitoxin domain-containing protein [bacterium]